MGENTVPFVYGGLDPKLSAFDTAKVLIWPVPFEKTVSYGHGTGQGPAAIIDASRYMELYDEELGGETADIGIHTLPAIRTEDDVDTMMAALHSECSKLLATEKFLCTLGGEHSITPPLVRATHEKYADLSVFQIDAHADLREEYEGSRDSHACAMRRVLECCPAVQVGIRSLSSDEARAIPNLRTNVFYAKDVVGRQDWVESAIERLSPNVYLTIDVDGLDPSIVPTTGTPEPGGFLWCETLYLLKTLAARRNIVAMDVVELSGSPENPAPAFLVAKLIYKTLGYIFRK